MSEKPSKRKAGELPKESTPANQEEEVVKMPQKRFFRQRAHCNPLSFSDSFAYPRSPAQFDYARHFPHSAKMAPGKKVAFVDIGCGFGGLLISLARVFPDKLILGMEIRTKVCEYVHQRILSLRGTARQSDPTSIDYQGISVCRANTMRYAAHFFEKGQLEKIFICFPDPHFKAKNHRRRIVSPALLDEYAYFLRPGGLLYTVTDVENLAKWHNKHCSAHLLFEKVSQEELASDEAVPLVMDHTEEGKKVAKLGRFGKEKYLHVFRRLAQPRKTFELL